MNQKVLWEPYCMKLIIFFIEMPLLIIEAAMAKFRVIKYFSFHVADVRIKVDTDIVVSDQDLFSSVQISN